MLGLINLIKYFGQDVLEFNYRVNGVSMLKAVDVINDAQGSVAASKSIVSDQRVAFFIDKPIKEISLEEIMKTDLENNYQVILIDPQGQMDLVKEFLAQPEKYTHHKVSTDMSPFRTVNYLVLE